MITGNKFCKLFMPVWTPLFTNGFVYIDSITLNNDRIDNASVAMTQVSGGYDISLGFLYETLRNNQHDLATATENQVVRFTIPENRYRIDGQVVDTTTDVSITFTPYVAPPRAAAITEALFNSYDSAGVLQKSQGLVTDPLFPKFDSIDVNDIVGGDVCSLVISAQYGYETPETPFTVEYKIDGTRFGDFHVQAQKNGKFTVDMSSMYQTVKDGGHDMRITESQLLTFTLPSYPQIINGVAESMLPIDIRIHLINPLVTAYRQSLKRNVAGLINGLTDVVLDVSDNGAARDRLVIAAKGLFVASPVYVSQIAPLANPAQPTEVSLLFRTPDPVTIRLPPLKAPYKIDDVLFGYGDVTADAEGLKVTFHDPYTSAMNSGYDMFARESQHLSLMIPPRRILVADRIVSNVIPFGFNLLRGVGDNNEFQTALDGVTSVRLKVTQFDGTLVTTDIASLPLLEMSTVFVNQLVPHKGAEVALEFVTSSVVTVTAALNISFMIDGVQFGTAAVSAAGNAVRVDIGALYAKVLASPSTGYDLFTKRFQELTFTLPASSISLGETPNISVVKDAFSFVLPIHLLD
eukprot:jgi/Mesvir1/6773/Mv03086-RA.1